MYVAVACVKCSRPFQVPQTAAGTDVACPWCKQSTPALPIANGSVASPPGREEATTPDTPEEPLSLDDAPPAPRPPLASAGVAVPAGLPVRLFFRRVLAGLALVVVVTAATVAILGYGEGRIPESAWAEFTAPDGSFVVALPGSPIEEPVEPNPASAVTRGGQKFVATGWYSGARAWVGWQRLDEGWAKQAVEDRGGALSTPVLQAERDRRRKEVGGTLTKEGTIKFAQNLGLVVQIETARGQLVEWYVLALEGNSPRLYFMGLEARNAATGGEPGSAAERIFNSFRISRP